MKQLLEQIRLKRCEGPVEAIRTERLHKMFDAIAAYEADLKKEMGGENE